MNTKRLSLMPIRFFNLWSLREKMQEELWLTNEIKLGPDLIKLDKLRDGEKHFLKYVLAFFNQADGIINENLALRFYNEVLIPEARAFYALQIYNESIHSETYGLLLETYYKHDPDKEKLFDAISHFPAIRKKAQWAEKWVHSNRSFAERLIAFAVVEGVFFSGSFAAVYWFKSKGVLEGLSTANQWIARDENTHCLFAVELYKLLSELYKKGEIDEHLNNVEFAPVSNDVIIDIFKEAVKVEQEFLTESLPVDMIGMNSRMMSDYIECCADYWLTKFGVPKQFNKEDPFGFMSQLGMESKTNFFEKTVTGYTQKLVNNNITFDEDF